ncbi:MAG: glycosyltransferase family 39 protein [Gloeobacteraceae cyanobacterium ES-bin-144]|nr:glycosyltransferase family 39 protein [Verrucomicrobiales bacterium]
MSQDASMFADYITPVLGKPWNIPMELPIYQWITARWYNLSNMTLDSCGKFISVIAWLACLIPVWILLKTLRFNTTQILFSLVLLLASPLYLFWSNAFLIETTGTLLGAWMVACAVRGHDRRSALWLAAAFGFSITAILCKATTWAMAAGMGGLLLVFRDGWPQWKSLFKKDPEKNPNESPRPRAAIILVIASLSLLLPIIAGKLWLNHGDTIKSANPFARVIIMANSAGQTKWNYGTLEQKLNPATWHQIWRHITDQLLVPFPLIGPFLMPLILIAGAIASPRRIPLILIFLAGFASGPIIFTNLYYEHSYYWCANGIWLLLAVGSALAGIWECRAEKLWPQITAVVLVSIVAISGFARWHQVYLPILTSLPTREQITQAWTYPVQHIVPPKRSLLVVGHDWNSNTLYYAERKGIAYPTSGGIQFPGPQLVESLSKLESEEKLGAVVIAQPLLTKENEAPLANILQQLGMSREGNQTAFGILFPAEDLKPTKQPNH